MKSFIYLDLFKMYSLSSQLLEGVTDYILEEKRGVSTEHTDQKGPVASGRRIGEIIEETSANFSKKFLHDYAFSIFEDRLREDGKLLELSVATQREVEIKHSQIVRVKARAKFVDYVETVKNLRSLDSSRQSMAIVSNNDEREELLARIEECGGPKRAESQPFVAQLKAVSDPKFYAMPANDVLFQKHLCDVIESNFGDALEIDMELHGLKVSADLNRDYLRESIQSIVKKYSRLSEVEFVMLGVVTQTGDIPEEPEDVTLTEANTMRDTVIANTVALAALESSIRRRAANEVVIDPIAVYVVL